MGKQGRLQPETAQAAKGEVLEMLLDLLSGDAFGLAFWICFRTCFLKMLSDLLSEDSFGFVFRMCLPDMLQD
jgi:hypothetical protein